MKPDEWDNVTDSASIRTPSLSGDHMKRLVTLNSLSIGSLFMNPTCPGKVFCKLSRTFKSLWGGNEYHTECICLTDHVTCNFNINTKVIEVPTPFAIEDQQNDGEKIAYGLDTLLDSNLLVLADYEEEYGNTILGQGYRWLVANQRGPRKITCLDSSILGRYLFPAEYYHSWNTKPAYEVSPLCDKVTQMYGSGAYVPDVSFCNHTSLRQLMESYPSINVIRQGVIPGSITAVKDVVYLGLKAPMREFPKTRHQLMFLSLREAYRASAMLVGEWLIRCDERSRSTIPNP